MVSHAPITLYPTIYPTQYPSLNPSDSTQNPTTYPSTQPTTYIPTHFTVSPTINPTIYNITIDETLSEAQYKLIDRYPTDGIIAVLIFGALFFSFCIFMIWRCQRFESTEHAKKLEAEYRKRAAKYRTNHFDHEEDG
eukprot:113871_1